MDKQITCVTRAASGPSPIGRITHVGGAFGRETEEHAIESLRSQHDTYFLGGDGSARTEVHVVEREGLSPFLATVGTDVPLHDVAMLGECPPSERAMPGDFRPKA